MAHLRRRPKHFAVVERCIYTCELPTCPVCATPLTAVDFYSWTKTVQQLDRVVSVAARPKRCTNPACPVTGTAFPPAAARTVALPYATYGFDVIAQIGYWRTHEALSSAQIHTRLCAQGLQISRRQVDHLSHQYQLLLAVGARQDLDPLRAVVATYGGLVLSLDGLAPEGISEQLWVVREVLSGTILLAGWLPRVSEATLTSWLRPVVTLLAEQGWAVRATVSDKQVPLAAALTALWPTVPHQWCQAHYLRNLAEPLEAHDGALKTRLRKQVRAAIRPVMQQVATAAAPAPGAFSPGGQ